MKIKQISIFLENKPGRIAEITKILKEAKINIRALSVADTSEFGILRIIVDNYEKAIAALKKNNYSASITDVIAVELDDRPGGLHDALVALDKENLNVEYMYAFVSWEKKDKALIIFRIENIEKAISVLLKAGFNIVSDIGS
ncbi:MAG TPA: ACT domain-containing protein [bacterium]|nr:ACT domain-containing protein [bacterium]HOL48924.1 ACT domain-containing protein [bacterium]HPQ17884.1 ACT domain-containing protein [bacterium]